MAAAHWIVSIWEDAQSAAFLNAGLDDQINEGGHDMKNANEGLSSAYFWHHLIATIGYLAFLYLRACTAVGTFGFVYELPVLLMNHREFIVVATPPPKWYRGRQVMRFWNFLYLSYVLARYTPTCFYLYSLVFWQEDIWALSIAEAIVYHGMAIVFSALSYGLQVNLLVIWFRRDREMYAPRLSQSAVHRDDAERAESNARRLARDAEQGEFTAVDENVLKVALVSPELLARKNGVDADDGESQEIWIEIEGAVYNVTQFLDKHPGGEAVFRKHAGKDATAGFKRAKHSVSAKKMMQQYLVGPTVRPPTAYKIFEHPDMLVAAFWHFVAFIALFGFPVAFIGQCGCGRLVAPGSSFPVAAVPGLLLSAISGNCLTAINLGFGRFELIIPHRNAFVFGACAALFHIGLVLARQPLPEKAALQACPSGLEIASVALFVLEDLLQALSHGFTQSPAHLLVSGAVALSWSFRACWLLLDVAPGHVLAALLMAPTACWMVRRINSEGDKAAMKAEVITGIQCAGVYSSMAVLACFWVSPAAWKIAWECADLPLGSLAGVILVANGATLGLLVLLNSAYECSPSCAVRAGASTMLFGVICAGGFAFGPRLLLALAFMCHLGSLGTRNRERLRRAEEEGRFVEIPPHAVGTQALWDQVRAIIFVLMWKVLISSIKAVLNFVLPEELTFFASELGWVELGSGVDLGVAAFFSPPAVRGQASASGAAVGRGTAAGRGEGAAIDAHETSDTDDRPNYFVCNVGHIENGHAASLQDMQRTLNALRDCWNEFSAGEVKGLLANVVCVFPRFGSESSKEINLSAWRSAEDAHDWYARSPGHRKIMKDHSGGHLRTFGNLLASLRPVSEIRHQDRCQRCARLVESAEAGQRAPIQCSVCHARTFSYPFM